MGQIGPIETSIPLKQEPYSLPEGLEWWDNGYDHYDEMIGTLTDDDNTRNYLNLNRTCHLVSENSPATNLGHQLPALHLILILEENCYWLCIYILKVQSEN